MEEESGQYTLLQRFFTATDRFNEWMMAEKTALDMALLVPRYKEIFRDVAEEKASDVFNSGLKIYTDDLSDNQRLKISNIMNNAHVLLCGKCEI